MLRQNMKTIRGWLEEEGSQASKYDINAWHNNLVNAVFVFDDALVAEPVSKKSGRYLNRPSPKHTKTVLSSRQKCYQPTQHIANSRWDGKLARIICPMCFAVTVYVACSAQMCLPVTVQLVQHVLHALTV